MASSIPAQRIDADELAERAQRVLPGGNTHAARAYSPAVYVERSQGSRKWLVDGRELVDYTMGHGALLLGHAHPDVVDAVQEQVARGTHYGAAHPLEVQWAERITALVPSAEQVRFTASGTEASMLAVRVARAATGRDVVVKLDGHFHGWYDAVALDLDADGRSQAWRGVPQELTRLTRVARPDAASIREALAPGDVAALILEPSGAHFGGIPLADGLVDEISGACSQTGTLLIFDEVVTGFRIAPGGMQAALGVTPDLSVLGKIMAGGLPGGAVAGRSELMHLLAGEIMHPGTFNANPLSAVAGITTLDLVADGTAQQTAGRYAAALAAGWDAALESAGVPGRVWRLASIVHVQLDDGAAQARLSDAMRAEGVDLLRTSAFCSTVHTQADLELTIDALRRAAATVSAAR